MDHKPQCLKKMKREKKRKREENVCPNRAEGRGNWERWWKEM